MDYDKVDQPVKLESELQPMSAIKTDSLTTNDLDRFKTIVGTVLSQALDHITTIQGWVGYVDRDSKQMITLAQKGLDRIHLEKMRLSTRTGFLKDLMARKIPGLVEKEEIPPSTAKKLPIKPPFFFVPIIVGERTVGIILLSSDLTDINFNTTDALLLISLSVQAGGMLESIRIYDNLSAREKELLHLHNMVLESRNKLLFVFDTIPDFIFTVDQQLKIININKAMAKKLGRHPRELVGQDCHGICAGVTCNFSTDDITCPVRQTFATGRGLNWISSSPGPDGEEFFAEAYTTPMADADGRIVQVIIVSRDITE
ncbi:MAG: PAS domain-containing protein, partial [Deltaproteobacteria bacterium]|nr:PAS domain-containing protein [Deltaproteobacteria bacterium]